MVLCEKTIAQTNSWISPSSGQWGTLSNWDLGVAPTNTHAIYLTNATTKTVTFDYNAPIPSRTVRELTIGGVGTATNTLHISGETLQVLGHCEISSGGSLSFNTGGLLLDDLPGSSDPQLYVGHTGSGTLSISGGNIAMYGPLWVGRSSNSTGRINLNSGLLKLLPTLDSVVLLGFYGSGEMVMSNGALDVEGIYLGVRPAARGTFTCNGGIASLRSNIVVGGDRNTAGAIWLNGGSMFVTNATLFVGGWGTGQVTVAGGVLNARTIMVASNNVSPGAFNVASGVVTVSNLIVCVVSNGYGTVTVTGGQLAATNVLIGSAGSFAQATFAGGSNRLSTVTVGPTNSASGGLFIAGGTNTFFNHLSLGYAQGSTGILWVTDGVMVITNRVFRPPSTTYWPSIFVGGNSGAVAGGSGQMIISNGTIFARSIVLASSSNNLPPATSGTLTMAGGTLSFNSTGLIPISINLSPMPWSTSAVWITDGQILSPTNSTAVFIGSVGVGQMTVSNGMLAGGGFMVGGGCGTLTIAGGLITSSFVKVGVAVGGTGVVWMTGGEVFVDNAEVGMTGSGTLCLSNGTFSTPLLAVASIGQVTLTSGRLFVTNSTHTAALTNQGTLTIDGGEHLFDRLINYGGVPPLVFNSGTIMSSFSWVSNSQPVIIGDGMHPATYRMLGGYHVFFKGLIIASNAIVVGCGDISGSVTINPGGTLLADCGGTITISGPLINNGVMRATGGSFLEAWCPAVNNGVIDLLTSGATNLLTTGSTNTGGVFINNGVIIDRSHARVTQAAWNGADFILEVPSVAGHDYQLQVAASLSPTNWISIGAAQAGSNGPLTFVDPSAITNSSPRFYRVLIYP